MSADLSPQKVAAFSALLAATILLLFAMQCRPTPPPPPPTPTATIQVIVVTATPPAVDAGPAHRPYTATPAWTPAPERILTTPMPTRTPTPTHEPTDTPTPAPPTPTAAVQRG